MVHAINLNNMIEDNSNIKPGMTVRVHEKIVEQGAKGVKERIQIFEGIVIGRKGGKGIAATITVRKIAANNIPVEKVYPLHSPSVVKIEPIKQAEVNRAKLYFLRGYKKKLKEKIL